MPSTSRPRWWMTPRRTVRPKPSPAPASSSPARWSPPGRRGPCSVVTRDDRRAREPRGTRGGATGRPVAKLRSGDGPDAVSGSDRGSAGDPGGGRGRRGPHDGLAGLPDRAGRAADPDGRGAAQTLGDLGQPRRAGDPARRLRGLSGRRVHRRAVHRAVGVDRLLPGRGSPPAGVVVAGGRRGPAAVTDPAPPDYVRCPP